MAHQILCQLVGETRCPRKFVKSLGYFVHGKWFCSPACADKDPEVKKIKEMLEKKERGEDIIQEDDEDYGDLDAEGGDVDL